MKLYLAFISLVAVTLSTVRADSETIPAEQEAFFEKHIRPALANYCYECHSLKGGKTLGGLLLDTRESIREGGDSGGAVVPGSVEDSVLWEAINWEGYEMPPKQKMPQDVIDRFKQWIEMGAPDPRERETFFVESHVDIESGKQHWAFQKPVSQGESQIDDLIDARLMEADLQKATPADGFTILRRLHFDLIGLPPTAKEARVFSKEFRVNPDRAVESKVDDLLDRPQFGERWGRHWLDIARYAESSGKVNFSFPHAWRYRDFVIDAFNNDTPYNHFVKQQIAGDMLPAADDETWQENLIATGFLTLGTKSLNERNPRIFRMDLVDEQIDAVSKAFLGMTVSCARCHDHKYDPVPTLDYYALAGIFLSTETLYGTSSGQQNHRPADLLLLPIKDKNNAGQDYSPEEIAGMRTQISEIRSSLRSRRSDAENGGPEIVQRDMVSARNRISRLAGILATVDEGGQAKTFGMGVQESESPRNANVLKGGDVEKPAQEVERGFLQVIDGIDVEAIPEGQSGRKQLAQWLASDDNPLTARVMVNRVWLQLFGEGLVRSPNNWGLQGESPTHPKLLDHLAVQFMDDGWSVKSLIRKIVTSRAYRRGSQYNEASFKADSENRLLWRMTPRQLDAESMRDSMLAVSGQLKQDRPYGSEIADAGNIRFGRLIDADDLGRNHQHRAVYLPIVRDEVNESLKLFDFADANLSIAKRDATNVPSQALYLLNSPFVINAAEKMAANLIDEHGSSKDRVQEAFVRVYGRPPTAGELRTSMKFIHEFSPVSVSTRPVATGRADRGANRVRGPNGRIGPNGPRGAQPIGRGMDGQRGGMTAGSQGIRRPGGRRRAETTPALSLPRSPEHQVLTLFCQSLLASAEFRILN